MNATAAIKAYQQDTIEAAVLGADPHMLVSMLYQGAVNAIARAKGEIARNDTEAKGKSISKAIAIIGEGLHSGLDMAQGGEIAQDLAAIYQYMVKRLIEANLNDDVAILDEVARLLIELKSTWDSIRMQVVQLGSGAPDTRVGISA